ncbi:MAG: Fpg/Nei family DNA glycosylase [Actinobacteria bacterium]|nr:Fpg/Nei family DNA glycosylase [Actinomycetota bacterium]MBU4206878.1 Fpg/Nei family DNA glycosylase [Actinomycetota bacterium]MBU4417588.1 Fpg/Nei family DNA glycosylase [Actinomycetota bacterium]MBU4589112.1 Fpg/Nei family DNA glycosylase [Actinomycetota bacterium]
MPEGHVIHRLAAELGAAFAGRPVRVTSPQGRFAAAAQELDGATLTAAEAYGKHLFIEFDARVIHLHLGLIGKLRWVAPGPVLSPATLRLLISNGRQAVELRGPQTCELITVAERDAVVAGLGPDPLRADADPQLAWQRVHRSARPIAALLMDQRIAAGVGNIYRCEVLFRAGVNPELPGTELAEATWTLLWRDLVELMPLGVRDGRIDTVREAESPERTGRPPRVDRHGGEVYVYRRAGDECLVCGRGISVRQLAGRSLYWCENCQPLR